MKYENKMLRCSFFAILLAVYALSEQQPSCEDRCTRLKQRSLNRIGYDDERLQLLFERQRPLESMKDVCWRLYDNIDCMKKCPKSEKHAVFAKFVRNKCKFVLSEMEPTLKCISKHHSFLTMRCSSFLNEASRLRAESDLSTTPRHDECRFLHLTTICLENHVNSFCPDGRRIFRRLNFRDYFLSFILPVDDDLFDDEDLDSCQIYDFVKDAEKRENEETERKQEEERRRRIEDDEDYEEELTTIVNYMEEGDGGSEKRISSPLPSSSSTSESTTSSSNLGSSSSSTSPKSSSEEFTTIIDDLIVSAERENQQEHEQGIVEIPTITNTEETEKLKEKEQEHEQGQDRQDLDSLVEKIHGDPEEKVFTTSTPTKEDEHQYTEPETDTEYSDHQYDEDYTEPENNNSTNPTISVVSIETRSSASEESGEQLVEVTTPDMVLNLTPPDSKSGDDDEDIVIETSTLKRKVFSEDSMENTPPNFFYSSNRYDITTRSNYVADNLDMQDSEEPLEIDTSTLFGVESTSSETEKTTSVDVTTTSTLIPVTTTEKAVDGKARPWLQGGVIVKPILNFDQLDVDLEEEREKEHRRNQLLNGTTTPSTDGSTSSEGDDFLSNTNHHSTNETLIIIGLIALIVCLILLVMLLLLAYFCSTRSDSYIVHKNEGSPPV
uniref:Chondroitin proteoglycan 4 domain-containing protein n=1 Tax=Caenorhabditis japonica TaxID=281687 RepID=A0A8R1DKD4_CAEJA